MSRPVGGGPESEVTVIQGSELKLSPELELWRQSVDLQKHFSGILFQIRSFCFAWLAALGAFAGTQAGSGLLAIGKDADWRRLLVLAPGVGLYFLDRFYYHQLLAEAVRVAEDAEGFLPGLRLSGALRQANRRNRVFGVIGEKRED